MFPVLVIGVTKLLDQHLFFDPNTKKKTRGRDGHEHPSPEAGEEKSKTEIGHDPSQVERMPDMAEYSIGNQLVLVGNQQPLGLPQTAESRLLYQSTANTKLQARAQGHKQNTTYHGRRLTIIVL